MDENQVSNAIIGAAIEVHRELGGPGLLEDVYEESLSHELGLRGFEVGRQVKVPVLYKGAEIKSPLFLDLLVDNKVIVEVKAVEKHNLCLSGTAFDLFASGKEEARSCDQFRRV